MTNGRVWQTSQEIDALGDGVVALWAAGKGRGPLAESMYAAWENPDRAFDPGDDDGFRLVIPYSGGLDSFAAATLAVSAGFSPELVYVDTGIGYSQHERRAADECAQRLSTVMHVWELPVDYVQHEHHDVARNLIILWKLAQRITSRARSSDWGEIWFGNTACWGEMPVKGGDKAHRFMGDVQALFYDRGLDVRISNPVGAMDKTDIARYLISKHGVTGALAARSCYSHTDPGHCGACLCCFKRYIAFHLAGVPEVDDTYTTLNFRELALDFQSKLGTQGNVIYSDARMALPATLLAERGWIKL